MRRTRPEPLRRARGVTLIEMIIAMIITAIIVAMSIFFANPLQQAADVTTRAELADIADNALQRIGRDVRLALPNSVRATTTVVEFIPVRTGGPSRVARATGFRRRLLRRPSHREPQRASSRMSGSATSGIRQASRRWWGCL